MCQRKDDETRNQTEEEVRKEELINKLEDSTNLQTPIMLLNSYRVLPTGPGSRQTS